MTSFRVSRMGGQPAALEMAEISTCEWEPPTPGPLTLTVTPLGGEETFLLSLFLLFN